MNHTILTGTLASPNGGNATGVLTLEGPDGVSLRSGAGGQNYSVPTANIVVTDGLITGTLVESNDNFLPNNSTYEVSFRGSRGEVYGNARWYITGATLDITALWAALAGISSTGGSATPGLPFNSVQFNNAGALGGSALFEFDGTQVHIGPAESTLPAAIQGWNRHTSNPLFVTSVGNYPAIQAEAAISDSGSGILSALSVLGSTGSAIEGDVSLAVSGVSGYCINAYGEVEAGIAADTLAGLHVWGPWFDSGGSVVNLYGLLIRDQTLGANNWAIKTGKGLVEFGDKVHIGPAESTLPAEIQGWTTGNSLFITRLGDGPSVGVLASGTNPRGVTSIIDASRSGYGVESDVNLSGAGASGTSFSTYSQVQAGFAASDWTGVWVQSLFMEAAATIGDVWGLLIDDQTAAPAGHNYAIKTGLGLVEFGDRLHFGNNASVQPWVDKAVPNYLNQISTASAGISETGFVTKYEVTPAADIAFDLMGVSHRHFIAGTHNVGGQVRGLDVFLELDSTGTFYYVFGQSVFSYNASSSQVDHLRGTDTYVESDTGAVGEISVYMAGGDVEGGSCSNLTLYNSTAPSTSGGAVITNAYGLFLADISVATNNWAIKTGKGLVEFGAAGDAVGTVGLHIAGKGAFDVGDGSATMLWLDNDGSNYGLVLTNRTAGLNSYTSMGVNNDGTFSMYVSGENNYGGLFYTPSSGNWQIQPGSGPQGAVQIPAGVLDVGAAGNAAGVSGLHIMGKGAFANLDTAGDKAQLWLDADDQTSWALAITNRTAGVVHAALMQVGDDGSFGLDVDDGNGGFVYSISAGWDFWGPTANVPFRVDGTVSVVSVKTDALTVATLPASPVAGQRAFVTDSNAVSMAAAFGAVLAAGGSTHVPCVYDGTNWRVG